MLKNCEKETRACRICNKELSSAHKTFCSWDCRETYGRMQRTITCSYCGKIRTLKKGDHLKENSKYCSAVCLQRSYSGANNHSWKGVKENRVCLTCNNVFIITTTKEKNSKLYCNKECRSKRIIIPKTVVVNCLYCNVEFKTLKKTILPKHCSRECADKTHSIKMSSKGNSNYVHGNGSRGYPVTWTNSFKRLIRDRDGFVCQLCYMTEEQHNQKLCVHHIDFDKLNLSPENLITLCKYCHGKFHGKYTREKCKEELLNLLKEREKSLTMCIT